MKQQLILLSSREQLAHEIAEQLGPQYEVSRLAALPELKARLAEGRCTAVLVHLEHTSLDETSAGRFVADLDAAVSNVPMYALIDEDCPNRLASLAARLADESLPLPLEYDRLRQLVNPSQDLEAELDNFWKEVTHRELHGQTRSLVTFTPDVELLAEVAAELRTRDAEILHRVNFPPATRIEGEIRRLMRLAEDLNYYNRYFVSYTQPLFQPNELKNDLEEAELDLESDEIDAEVLERLEASDREGGARPMIDDLPLFSRHHASAHETPASDPVADRLAETDPDRLTPMDALSLVYDLKALAAAR